MRCCPLIEPRTELRPVRVPCCVLAVSAAGYSQWRQRPAAAAVSWRPAAQAAFTRHARQVGTRRLRAELQAEGHTVGRYALRSWRHGQGLRALSTRPQRPRTTVADLAAIVVENRLPNQPAPIAPDQVWVGDITHLPLVCRRWCYLATWPRRCPPNSCCWPWEQALTLRQPVPGLIVHADRGSPYTHAACRARIAQAGTVPIFSRPGNPYDHALRQRATGYGPGRSR